MSSIEVVALAGGGAPPSGAFGRRRIFETEDVRVGETRIGPAGISPWHHHGRRTLYGYVVSGMLTLEFGPRGAELVRVSAGEFFRIPPGLVHRDVNNAPVEAVITNVVIGEGPATIDVSGPER